MNIVSSNILNAVHSIAEDHVVAVTNDIYDESLQKYQSDINRQIDNRVYVLEHSGSESTGVISDRLSKFVKFTFDSNVVYPQNVTTVTYDSADLLPSTPIMDSKRDIWVINNGGKIDFLSCEDLTNPDNRFVNVENHQVYTWDTTKQKLVLVETGGSSVIEVSDIELQDTSDTSIYPEFNVPSSSNARNVKVASFQFYETTSTVTLTTEPGGSVNILGQNSANQYNLSEKGDSITIDNGTTMEVVSTNVDSVTGNKNINVLVTVPNTNSGTEAIVNTYNTTTSGGNTDQLTVVQNGQLIDTIAHEWVGPQNGYLIHAGYAEGLGGADITALATADIDAFFATGKDNFMSSSGSIYIYPNTGVSGTAWYAAPVGKDYTGQITIENGSDGTVQLLQMKYASRLPNGSESAGWYHIPTENDSLGYFRRARNGSDYVFMWQNTPYYIYYYENTAKDGERTYYTVSASNLGLSYQEVTTTADFIRSVSVIDDEEALKTDYQKDVNIQRVFNRTNNVWVNSKAHTLGVWFSHPKNDPFKIERDVDWITDAYWREDLAPGGARDDGHTFGSTEKSSYFVTIAAMDTPSTTPRVGTVKFTNSKGSHTLTIVLRQSQLTVTPNSLVVNSDGTGDGSRIYVTSNSGISMKDSYCPIRSISSANWITTDYKIYDGPWFIGTDLTAHPVNISYGTWTVGTNSNTSSLTNRTGVVTVYGRDDESPVNISVSQRPFDFRAVKTWKRNGSISTTYGDYDIYTYGLASSNIKKVDDQYQVVVTANNVDYPAEVLQYYFDNPPTDWIDKTTVVNDYRNENTGAWVTARVAYNGFGVNVPNRTLDDIQATLKITTADNVVHSTTFTIPKATASVDNIIYADLDVNLSGGAVGPYKIKTSYSGAMTVFNVLWVPEGDSLNYPIKQSDVNKYYTDKANRVLSSVQWTSTSGSDQSYNYMNLSATIPANDKAGAWVLIIGNADDTTDASGNVKSLMALNIYQH